MTSRMHRTLAELWFATARSGSDALVTLSQRVPMLISGQASPRETSRMVTEKVAATVLGTQAAGIVAARALGRRAGHPLAAAELAVDMAAAASRPFHARVRANAKRLSRRSPK